LDIFSRLSGRKPENPIAFGENYKLLKFNFFSVYPQNPSYNASTSKLMPLDSRLRGNDKLSPIEVRHSRGRDCVAIGKTTHTGIYVIPGLTRNPVFFQSVTLLDAGSSPA
jgi:hypothetical protein